MEEHTYKVIEVVGSSTKSSDDAVRCAIERAAASLRELRWFEVAELRGDVNEGRITHWQATVKIGFRLDERQSPDA